MAQTRQMLDRASALQERMLFTQSVRLFLHVLQCVHNSLVTIE
jgi:hypothetical protein